MNYIGVYTLIKKEIVRFIRVPLQTIGSPVVTTALYFAVFGASIGSRIGVVDGLSYTQFIMPGLIMMNVVMVSFTGIASGFMLAKMLNTMSDILVTPLSNLEIILGFTIASTIRTVATAAIIYITALFFLPFRVDHPLYLITFISLVAFAFSLFGVIAGLWATTFEQMTIFPTFLITPLSFLGGIFYSTKMLPPFFKAISHYNPLLYAINGLRYGFFGVTDVSPLFAYSMLLLFTAVLMAITLHLFKIGYKIRT